MDHSEIPGSLKLFHCSYKWDLECISTFGASKSASIWYNSDTSKEDEKLLCSRMRIRKLLLKTKMGQIVDSKKFNNIVEYISLEMWKNMFGIRMEHFETIKNIFFVINIINRSVIPPAIYQFSSNVNKSSNFQHKNYLGHKETLCIRDGQNSVLVY